MPNRAKPAAYPTKQRIRQGRNITLLIKSFIYLFSETVFLTPTIPQICVRNEKFIAYVRGEL